ncbi:MAG: GntR family transcriptional regulator [Pseudomonadota bacterium]
MAEAILAGQGERPSPRANAVKLSEIAYERFKEQLFANQIVAGSTVSQADLVRQLGVPLSPVREAILILQAEGLVRVNPRSGIDIVKPDLTMIRNAYQMRMILEREATRKFAELCSPAELDAIEANHEAVLARIDPNMSRDAIFDSLFTLDSEFHNQLIASFDNPVITDAYGQTVQKIRLIRLDRRHLHSPHAVRKTIEEHRVILKALRDQDVEAAVTAMDAHMRSALHRIMGF